MRFITATAVSKRSVTVLAVFLLLAAGVFAYRSLQVELFPEIEFPLATVFTSYPGAHPEAVVRDVSAPIEREIAKLDGLDTIQSSSFEGNSIIVAAFEFGADMDSVESDIRAAMSGIAFADGVEEPIVGRFNPDLFPVISVGLVSEGGVAGVRDVVRSRLLPALAEVDGVMQVSVDGDVSRQVRVTVDPRRLDANGVTLPQVSAALSENNLTLPAGLVFDQGRAVLAKTTHSLSSVSDIEALVVGAGESGPVRLADVADVSLSDAIPTSISRTNGRTGIGVSVIKDPDVNTIEVTSAVREVIDGLEGLPPDVEVIVTADQGPDIQRQIDNLLQEAIFGFIFAVTVVFLFMLTIRPTVLRGMLSTLRPTVVIALSIPLSVFTGVLLMAWQDMTLNFMTLGGLAISVGRVVDDSIVVLENVYRHIQGGRERWRAALEATAEVGPAIFASTMATIVVFIPLGFIEGLVGAFFLPFALTVSFALVASLLVALTAVPVLGAYLLRPGDLPEGAGEDDEILAPETWMQRVYTPILRWTLGHKVVTLAATVLITAASLGLLAVIPVSLFPSGGERFLIVHMTLPPGTPLERTLEEVRDIEDRLSQVSDTYTTTIGAGQRIGGNLTPRGLNYANFEAALFKDAPEDIARTMRRELAKPGRVVSISERVAGPPVSGVEITVTGPDYRDVAEKSLELVESLRAVDGIVNIESDVVEARDEISIEVDPVEAAAIGLNTRQVGLQLGQYLTGRAVTSITIDDEAIDVVLLADPRSVRGVEGVKALTMAGPLGSRPLGEIAQVTVREGPVTISRTDGARSVQINGDIDAEDIQKVGRQVDEKIAALALPPGVRVNSGGVFSDIAEGFQAIFISMAVGIVLVYLVMVASLGSLRNPLVIVVTLPLALIGALAALAVTGRSLSLPAMMGILLLIGIVVTNAVVLIAFVEQLRARGFSLTDALITGGRVRLRPILMTAMTTSFALVPLAAASADEGGIIGAEMATVVIGGLISSTFLTLIVLPIVYTIFNQGIFSRGHPSS